MRDKPIAIYGGTELDDRIAAFIGRLAEVFPAGVMASIRRKFRSSTSGRTRSIKRLEIGG